MLAYDLYFESVEEGENLPVAVIVEDSYGDTSLAAANVVFGPEAKKEAFHPNPLHRAIVAIAATKYVRDTITETETDYRVK